MSIRLLPHGPHRSFVKLIAEKPFAQLYLTENKSLHTLTRSALTGR
jgi:hypothetical protein